MCSILDSLPLRTQGATQLDVGGGSKTLSQSRSKNAVPKTSPAASVRRDTVCLLMEPDESSTPQRRAYSSCRSHRDAQGKGDYTADTFLNTNCLPKLSAKLFLRPCETPWCPCLTTSKQVGLVFKKTLIRMTSYWAKIPSAERSTKLALKLSLNTSLCSRPTEPTVG